VEVADDGVLVGRLHDLILRIVPEAETVSKYGGTLYTLYPDENERQFCGVFSYKNHVQLSFSAGASLKDPQRLLTGGGKYRRHINFRRPEEIDEKPVSDLLQQAARESAATD
jgi:hypothetical protein